MHSRRPRQPATRSVQKLITAFEFSNQRPTACIGESVVAPCTSVDDIFGSDPHHAVVLEPLERAVHGASTEAHASVAEFAHLSQDRISVKVTVCQHRQDRGVDIPERLRSTTHDRSIGRHTTYTGSSQQYPLSPRSELSDGCPQRRVGERDYAAPQ